MKKISQLFLNIFLFFVFILFLGNITFANVDEQKTIKQLKDNIEVLKSKKVINFSEFELFKKNNGDFSDYFSKNLSEENISKIEEIIKKYNLEKNKILKSDFNDKNFRLTNLKKKLYIDFIIYIDVSKIKLYNEFVNKKFSTLKKSEEIKKDIKNKENIIEKKISNIKNKIKENHRIEQEKLNTVLKEKIKNKILKFQKSKRIQALGKQKQKLIFQLVLKKILKKKEENINITEKQLNLYNILEEVLIEIINGL